MDNLLPICVFFTWGTTEWVRECLIQKKQKKKQGITLKQETKKRQRRDLNPRGQSPIDFESISLTTRTRCLPLYTVP